MNSKNCADYDCFGVRNTSCMFYEQVICDNSGQTIISMHKVNRKSVGEALVLAVSLSHNMEIGATTLVVLIVVFCCMTRQQREEMQITITELAAIVQEKNEDGRTAL